MLVLSAVEIYAKKYCEETLYTPRFTKTSTKAQNLLLLCATFLLCRRYTTVLCSCLYSCIFLLSDMFISVMMAL